MIKQPRQQGTTALGTPIVNLSRYYELDEAQTNLLNKGLTYCPTPLTTKDARSTQRLKGIMAFNRRVKLDYHFRHKPPRPRPKFRLPTGWTPDQVEPDIAEFCTDTCELAQKSKDQHTPDNLSKQERTALRQLRNNTDIVIKPADKGSATVIMDRDDYIHEATRQLNDTQYYTQLQEPIYNDTAKQITDIINDMADKKRIKRKVAEYLLPPDEPRQRCFYLLPKIHKERTKWTTPNIPPGRPIVSDCGSETYDIAEWIDYHLQPIASSHQSYLKDTNHLLEIIGNTSFDQNALLVTMDVNALYTNIDHDDGIAAIEHALQNNPKQGRPDDDIIQLLDISLRKNDFGFNGNTYLQVKGTAMGKRYAPSYANIFMAQWEERARSKSQHQPSLYKRFIDDIVMVWENGRDELTKFINILNTAHPSITLTWEINPMSINFLDTTIFKGTRFHQSGILDTKVYFKPTDTHQLLHRSSYHPRHTFAGIVKSQVLRFRRICNNDKDFHAATKTVFNSLTSRGYSERQLRRIKADALKPTCKNNPDTSKRRLLPIVLPHSESNHLLANKVKSRFELLLDKTKRLDKVDTVAAYTKHKSLKDLLTSSKLKNKDINPNTSTNPTPHTQRRPTSQRRGTSRCDTPRCKTCKHIKPTTVCRSHNKMHAIRSTIDCATKEVIYCLHCSKCNLQYVGQTGNTLRERVSNHLSCIRKKVPTPVSLHFNQQDHNIHHCQVIGLQHLPSSTRPIREAAEQDWIQRLNTLAPLGIN